MSPHRTLHSAPAVPSLGYGSGRRAYDLLRMRIRTGDVRPDELFVDTSLVRSLAASRSAVRGALQVLAEEGLLQRSPRSGTRLRGQILKVPLFGEVKPQADPLAGAGLAPAERLLVRPIDRRIVDPTDTVSKRLELAPDARVVMIEQLLLVDGEPIGVRSAYYSPEPDAERVLACFASSEHHPLPFDAFFRRVYGTVPRRSDISIEAVPSQPGDTELLGTAAGMPILMRTLVQRDQSDRPRTISFTHLRGDRIALSGSLDGAVPTL